MSHDTKKGRWYQIRTYEQKVRSGLSLDPIIHAVDLLLLHAFQMRASDIHLEPLAERIRIRFRIDGILHDQAPLPVDQGGSMVSRLKILAALDIAQKRLPQDGKFRVVYGETEQLFDLRVATFPCLYGEKMVLRILDGMRRHEDLAVLGFSLNMAEQLCQAVNKPHGLFLVTGPTGSGKTTTLYALLAQLNKPERNIITMEDPVEYSLDGIVQSQVNEQAGFTFHHGLRSLVRQDPDVMMIGEVRDSPTVQIATQAALTGHLVLSTLHTNDAPGAITRLLDMGIEPFLLGATLCAVLAQRLVRRLCSACKKETQATPQEVAWLKIQGIHTTTLWRQVGCQACYNLGYQGRTGIFELLIVDEGLQELIVQKALLKDIKTYAFKQGMKGLMHSAGEKLLQGVISLEEYVRICGGRHDE